MRRWVAVITLAIFVSGALFFFLQIQNQSNELHLHGNNYHITVRRTETERQKGLSGSDNLPKNDAMLFVFDDDSRWGIWMKDMKYPIDIVWLDNNKKVVYMVKDAQPASYPKIFIPDKDARYVIELASGTIEQTDIKLGDLASITSGL
ncbi:MAG: DUF192 domain-containing protein [Candidatus Saccharimonadales bacterium]